MRGAVERIRYHGLDLPDAWCVVTEDYESDSTRAAAQKLLAGASRPTAVSLTGDILALGVVPESRALGPVGRRDIATTGCGATAPEGVRPPSVRASGRGPFFWPVRP